MATSSKTPLIGVNGLSSNGNTITNIGATGNSLSLSANNALTLTTTGATTVTLPTTGTLASIAGTQTLTNKTIAAGSNTITGLTNSNLSGTAGITNANLANSSTTIGSTAIALGASSTTLAGLTSVSSTGFTGALTGNADTATTLKTARNIQGVSFDGSANITVVTAGTGIGVSGTTVSNTGVTTISGTTNQITASASTGGVTLSLPSSLTTPGDLTVSGNLTVSGTTTTVNSTTVAVADLNIELAKNATTAAQANGAGLTIDGPATPATLTYTSADDRWNFNKNLNVTTVYGALSGNASTATTLQTARTINGVSFDGSAAITVTTAGTGIGVSGTTISNAGVTSNVAGTGISVSGATGAVTITNTGILSITGTAPVSASTTSGATTISMAAATASVNGYMTSTYAAKLDGIAAGATNVTNNNQLTNGAGYITGITSANVTTALGFTPYNATNPSSYITSSSNTSGTHTGAVSTSSACSTGALTVTGAITATGEVTAYYSDLKLKTNIVTIADALDKVEAINGVTFDPNETALALGIDNRHQMGVIAQEVEAVAPELVCDSAFKGYKTVRYDKLTALLIEAVKELSAKVKVLEAQVGSKPEL